MGPLRGFFDGPVSFFVFWRMLDRRAWAIYLGYTLFAGGMVTAFAVAMLALGPEAKESLLDYLFPQHWRLAGRMVFERFFGKLGNQVLANFIINGSMSVISLTCFAFKEQLSRRIEHTNDLLPGGHSPWPLWRQGVEELKYVLLYWFAYNVIFWISYPPWPATRLLGQVLSYLVLFLLFNIIFLCPLFLRHRVGYARMVRTFFARPFASFGFAAFFLAPSLIAAQLLAGQEMKLAIPVLLVIHVLTVAPAASAGTWVAARLLPAAQALRPTRRVSRVSGLLVMALVVAASGYVFSRLADSINAKTQILKCDYSVDWSSFELDPPSLSDLSVGLSLDIEITNPTEVDVRIENSRLEVENAGRHFGTVHLGRIEVPAGATRRQRVDLRLEIALGRLLEYKDLLDKPWELVLWVEVDEDWEFPVYFR